MLVSSRGPLYYNYTGFSSNETSRGDNPLKSAFVLIFHLASMRGDVELLVNCFCD
jgi:hypothetical protein